MDSVTSRSRHRTFPVLQGSQCPFPTDRSHQCPERLVCLSWDPMTQILDPNPCQPEGTSVWEPQGSSVGFQHPVLGCPQCREISVEPPKMATSQNLGDPPPCSERDSYPEGALPGLSLPPLLAFSPFPAQLPWPPWEALRPSFRERLKGRGGISEQRV